MNPHRELRKKTPEEVFIGKKPEVGNLRIFGSMAYYHVPSEKRSKLDQTAERGFLVGYSEVSKAYRIYIPSSRKVAIRQDVKFMEDRYFQKSCDMSTEDQTAEVPLVQEQQGHQEEQTERQTLLPSTGTNIFLEEVQEDTQSEEQPDQEEDLRE